MDEIWIKLDDFPDYSVSSLGRVRRDVDGKGSGRGKGYAGRIMEGGMVGGYRSVTLRRDSKSITGYIHFLVCKAFHGPRPTPLHEAAHKNDIRTDDREDNLYWATRSQNRADARKHDLLARGMRHPSCILTEGKVREIKVLLAEGCLTQKAIGERYGVARETIRSIKSGRGWGWLV